MPEIKHDFTAGKMNKDLDERLVPNGQYRDAMNIQVRTTTGDDAGEGDAGSVQNLQGNSEVGTATGDVLYQHELSGSFKTTDFKCVGAIASEKNDKAYFLFTSGNSLDESHLSDTSISTTELFRFDTIVEQDLRTGACVPVVVDKWQYQAPITKVWNSAPTGTFTTFLVDSDLPNHIRENMTISFYNGTALVTSVKIKQITFDNYIKLYDQVSGIDFSTVTTAVFEHERVLKFSIDINITGLNVIDDLLFWTDGITEPKKINITRCKDGTDVSGDKHTQLKIEDEDGDLQLAGDLELTGGVNSDLKEEHITVIRPAPKTPPTIHMDIRNVYDVKFDISDFMYVGSNATSFTSYFDLAYENEDKFVFIGQFEGESWEDQETESFSTSYDLGTPTPSLDQLQLQPGDIFTVTQQDLVDDSIQPLTLTLEFIGYMPVSYTDGFDATGQLESVATTATVNYPTTLGKFQIKIDPQGDFDESTTDWKLELKSVPKPLFEMKFGRFGYRYKYEDGEYSAFSPWSEVAFDPGRFDYEPKKGYNLGMVNTIQELTIKDFIPYYTDRALDVVEIDILFKATDSPNVYTIKTIKKELSPEWELFTPNNNDANSIETGKLKIKTENIHRVLPSNQILRAFDNVPRSALAQEITGSRILYGNFVQGFDVKFPVGLKQHTVSESVNSEPKRSVKTIRDYTLGMVFGDKYGRETPVITSSKVIDTDGDGTYDATVNEIAVPRDLCDKSNKIVVEQEWSNPLNTSTPDTMNWMDYVKYYVKETSNEYYNLVLDRWYYAQNQDNIWLSFTSADRNKLDIETYLLLKKNHGDAGPVLEKARYKVIAIENEAPDFIKTDRRNMGMVELKNEDVSLDGTTANPNMNSAEPAKLTGAEDGKAIDVMEWNDFLREYGINKRGDLYARIVGRTINESTGVVINELVSGDFKKVTHHTSNIGDGTGVVHFAKSFGQSANMVDRFNAAGFDLNTTESDPSASDLRYFIEFEERVVENKPEFDGRFFVLIEKDIVIQESVEKTTSATAGFIEIDQIVLSYVDSQWKNPAENGPYGPGGTGAGNKWGGSTSDVNYGLYNNTEFADDNDNSVTDPGPVDEWWGFGHFSSGPRPEDVYDARQAHLFALGCCVGNLTSSWYQVQDPNEDDGVLMDGPQPVVGAFGNNSNLRKVINYGTPTRNYWSTFNKFHRGSDGWERSHDNGTSRNHRIFLDGARAAMFNIQEYNQNVNLTNEVGSNPTGSWIMTNDDYQYSPDSIVQFNYKPTALDQGGANTGTKGRMQISQLHNQCDDTEENCTKFKSYSEVNGVGNSDDIWTYFTTPGTYFEFMDDTSDMSDPDFPNGKPYIYKVIDRDINNPDIQLAPQKCDGRGIKNYGDNFGSSYDPQGDFFRAVDLSTERRLDYPAGTLATTTSPVSGGYMYWAGENVGMWEDLFNHYAGTPTANEAQCTDDTGATVDCGYYIGYNINNTIENYGWDLNADGIGATNLLVGARQNEDGGDKKHETFKTCGRCGSDDAYCNRVGVRFEFRRVNSDGTMSNDGVDTSVFDPRGWAKHDGTAGGIRMAILQPQNQIGGEAIEIPENKAVWETEPKEGTELDIYYEATHALPMKLKEGNAFSFAPLKSIVKGKSVNNGIITDNNLFSDADGNTYSNVIVGGAGYTENDVIIKVISDSEDVLTSMSHNTEGGLHAYKIGIGDQILFEHSSGLVTQSVVQGYYKLDTNGVTFIEQTAFQVNITFDGAIQDDPTLDGFAPSGTVTITNTDGSTFDQTQAGFSSGMYVYGGTLNDGSTMPNNIFLKNYTENNQLILVEEFLPNFTGDGSNIIGTNDAIITNATMIKPTGYYKIDKEVYKYPVKLGWHNCWSFGNGVESDRIRDDYNAPQMDNGVRVSTTVVDYGKENRTSSLIYSGLYNTTSGVNDLNEFNMGEKILKDVNPAYGSIQALKTRDTDVVTFCEDKVLKVLANKEAVFNADGNAQLTATDRVLGQVTSFVGDYGISKNPESLATDQYRMYFTDSQRGAVLRLSRDGLTPISNVGMKAWFRDNLRNPNKLLGTFDIVNGEYNLTINNSTTLSFNEGAKGWVSFKSFIPDQGVSVTGSYLTVKDSGIFKHYVDTFGSDGEINNRNKFYNAESAATSSITILFNDMPGTVKSFKTINYEGSQARIDQDINTPDGEYYNIFTDKKGWWVSDVHTDLQEGQITHFIDKENKWFNRIVGIQTSIDNIDTSEFTVQGIGGLSGKPAQMSDEETPQYTLTIKNDPDQ